jgi:hypothetical protein
VNNTGKRKNEQKSNEQSLKCSKMNLFTMVKRVLSGGSHKILVPIVLGILLYARKGSSESLEIDLADEASAGALEKLPYCDEGIIKERGLTKRYFLELSLFKSHTSIDPRSLTN